MPKSLSRRHGSQSVIRAVLFGGDLLRLGYLETSLNPIRLRVDGPDMSTGAGSAGWYLDPHVVDQLRYFDGSVWSQHTAPIVKSPGTATVLPASKGVSAGFGDRPSDPVHWLLPTGRTWQSIVAGYVALFAILIWPLGPIAFGLGLWALVSSSSGGSHGRGRAWFAVVVGTLATLATLFLVVPAISYSTSST
ncbi:MAG TPA: DUF2510 domain-containing protein [Actinomycetes bacterium]|nr:DUF2510 domain-containing protein [Actinomycetes bacterium]